MTRNDFEIIADVISKLPTKVTKTEVENVFANRLKLINPSFNRDKFYGACKPSYKENQ